MYSLQSCKFFLLFLALKSANPGNILPQKLKTLVFRLPCLIFALTNVEHCIFVELCDIQHSINFKKKKSMGFIVFEEEAFNYLDAQLENFVKRMDRIRERSEDKTMNKWLDTQDVCQTLNICPRTVQTLRDNGTLAYTQISHKTYYKPEDVMAIVAVVEDKKKDMRFRKRTG